MNKITIPLKDLSFYFIKTGNSCSISSLNKLLEYSIITIFTLYISSCSSNIWLGEKDQQVLEGPRINLTEDTIGEYSPLKNVPKTPYYNFQNTTKVTLPNFDGHKEHISYINTQSNNMVMLGNDKNLYSIKNNNIKLIAKNIISSKVFSRISVIDNSIYIMDGYKLHLLNNDLYDTGSNIDKLWSYNLEYPIASSLITTKSNICFQDINFNIVCVYKDTGDSNLFLEDIANEIVVASDQSILNYNSKIIFSSKDGFIRAIDPEERAIEWEYNTSHKFSNLGQSFYNISSMTIQDNVLIASAYSTGVYFINAINGQEIYNSPIRNIISISALNGIAALASNDGNIYLIDYANQKPIWHKKIDMESHHIKKVIIANSGVLIICDNGNVSRISLSDGNIEYKYAKLDSGIVDIIENDTSLGILYKNKAYLIPIVIER